MVELNEVIVAYNEVITKQYFIEPLSALFDNPLDILVGNVEINTKSSCLNITNKDELKDLSSAPSKKLSLKTTLIPIGFCKQVHDFELLETKMQWCFTPVSAIGSNILLISKSKAKVKVLKDLRDFWKSKPENNAANQARFTTIIEKTLDAKCPIISNSMHNFNGLVYREPVVLKAIT